MIKKHSLFFQVVLFGKLLCLSDKDRFYFDDIIVKMMLNLLVIMEMEI